MQGFVLVVIAKSPYCVGRTGKSTKFVGSGDGVSPVSLASTDAARPTHWGVFKQRRRRRGLLRAKFAIG